VPYLPIEFFKTKTVTALSFDPEIIFESSGTTGDTTSRHFVKKLSLYQRSFLESFELFYGKPSGWRIIALLPGYLERTGSSLVYMADHLIQLSGHPESGFYLYDHEKLRQVLLKCESDRQPVLLLGVTFALLDFAEKYSLQLKHTIVMETGGMKGRREEITRSEVHHILKKKLGVKNIHSEYGMTELLSQAYAHNEGIFKCPPWMKVVVREENDPFAITSQPAVHRASGGLLNIIDLANIYSCSFIATDDIGKLHPDGSFEVLGRKDNSDIRGCSLLTANPETF
ncbi:MAG TPA: hypothetical protein VG847_09760, partial [Chitinophagaceae bacterium]|nr:hypothetical protein [Chitinophagaceae bacterium]